MTWGDKAATYRMLENERRDWPEILGAHSQCTMQRMAALPVVLCLTDTTELDFNGQTIIGLGPLSFEAQQVIELIEWYRARWEIEMFFHVLKNGCRVEALQLASLEKIERALTPRHRWHPSVPSTAPTAGPP